MTTTAATAIPPPPARTLQERREIKRVNSTALLMALELISGATLILGVLAGFMMMADKNVGAGALVALSSAISAAFLYGFSDMVRSLRSIARNTIK